MFVEKYFELLDAFSSSVDRKKLAEAALHLSCNYRQGSSTKKSFSKDLCALAYLFTRFPATYAVSYEVLQRVVEECSLSFKSVLDLGAGIGSFSLASLDLMEEEIDVHLVEDNSEMLNLSKKVFSYLNRKATWHNQTYLNSVDVKPLDIVCFCYTLTELCEEEKAKALELATTLFEKALVIIEPGTPKGYQNIIKAREFFFKKGYHILLPCPHEVKCPLKGQDWCHFSKRLPRHPIHKYLKQAQAGFEDEKYSYLVVGKTRQAFQKDRVLMPPKKASGLIQLKLCSESGFIQEKTITKKEKQKYKDAKKASWGDTFKQ